MTNSPTGGDPGINKESKECYPYEQNEHTFYGGDDQIEGAADVTRELIDKHISYIGACKSQDKKVPDECYRCYEQLVKEFEGRSSKQRVPYPNATSTPSPFSDSVAFSLESSTEPGNESTECEESRNYDVVVTEICKDHKRFLRRSATALKELRSERRCDLCELIKQCNSTATVSSIPAECDDGDVDVNTSCDPDKSKDEAEILREDCVSTESNVTFSQEQQYCFLDDSSTPKPLLTKPIKTPFANRSTISRSDCAIEDTEARNMPRNRIDYEKDDEEETKRIVCTCRREPQPDPSKTKNTVSQNDIGRRSNCGRLESIELCVKCGGRLDEVKSKNDMVAQRSNTGKSMDAPNCSVKSILHQRNSYGQQKPCQKETSMTFKCTCKNSEMDEEDEPMPITPSVRSASRDKNDRPKSPVKCQETIDEIICKYCDGLIVADEALDLLCSRTADSRSEQQMNEAIMQKREEVWGNNIPPGFIINNTEYSKRHNDCCVNNTDTDCVKYKCPKSSAFKLTMEENKKGCKGTDNDSVKVECMMLDERRSCKNEPFRDRSPERIHKCSDSQTSANGIRSNKSRENVDRCTNVKSQRPVSPKTLTPKRTPVGRYSASPARPTTRSRPDSKSCQPRKECHPEIVVTTSDCGKILSFTCKTVHDDDVSDVTDSEETSQEEECRVHGKVKETDSGWYDKINKQIRSYMDIDEETDGDCPRPAEPCGYQQSLPKETPERKQDPQRSSISCVVTLPPESIRSPVESYRSCSNRPLTEPSKPSCQPKAEPVRSKETQTCVSSIRSVGSITERLQNLTRETQTSKDTLGSAISVRSLEDDKKERSVSKQSVNLCLCSKMSREMTPEKRDHRTQTTHRPARQSVTLEMPKEPDAVSRNSRTGSLSSRQSQQRPSTQTQTETKPDQDACTDRFGEFPNDDESQKNDDRKN